MTLIQSRVDEGRAVGIVVGVMAARGEVSLTDPVAKYLPEEVTMPSRGGREITLLDLSTHYSALPPLPGNFSPSEVMKAWCAGAF